MEEKRVQNKRNRSKSASTSSDSQKSRSKVELPRGKSFNAHGTRQIIKTTQDENVVILARTSVINEGRKSNVKLKSFGVSARSKETASNCGGPAEPPSSNEGTLSDRLPEDFIRNDDCNDMEAVGHVSLSDAIQANAVYTRLQQKKEKDIDITQNGSSSRNNGFDVGTNSIVLSDNINSSAAVTTLKQTVEESNNKGSSSWGNERRSNEDAENKDEHVEINEKQGSDVEKHETTCGGTDMDRMKNENTPVKEGHQICPVKTDKQSSNGDISHSAKPLANNFVKTVAVNAQNKACAELFASGRSMSFGGDNKKGSPPAVKPKPKIPKRPTVEKIALLHDSEEKEEFVAVTEDTKGKSPPFAIGSRVCATETSAKVCGIAQQNHSTLSVEKDSTELTTQGHCETSNNSQNGALNLPNENKHSTTDKCLAETSVDKDISATLSNNIGIRTALGNGDSPVKQFISPVSNIVQNTQEDDVFLENSTQPRNKSESEAESAGSLDSLTSLTSQVTVIFNPETKESKKPLVAKDTPTPGPFESHGTNRRRKSTPEPYSSHPERRPKPGKAPLSSSVLKPKSRKIKSLYGRRLNASPPSTPPPPPKVDHSESSPPVDKSKNRPPVPPRAPSMYIQNDSVSIDNNTPEKAPPPRPLKPPILRDALNLEKKDCPDMLKQPTDSVYGKESVTQSDSVMAGESDSIEISRVVANGSSEYIGTAETLAKVDLRQQAVNTSISQPNKDFSRKLEYFKDTIDKPKRSYALFKQRSLDSYQEKVATAQTGTLPSNFAQLRKEGEEALRTVSRLRMENGDVIVNKKKSPAPQKPKRPSSVNMDNVVIFGISEVSKDIEIDTPSSKGAKLGGRIPPPKPERSPLTRKSNTFEIMKKLSGNIQTEAKELIPEEVLPDVELRSMDSEQCKDLKSPNEKRTVPKKPVRTSSLKRRDHCPMKVETRKEPTVDVVNEESLTKKDTDSSSNFNLKCDDSNTGNKADTRLGVDVTCDHPYVDSIGKDVEKERPDNRTVEKEALAHLVDAEMGFNIKFSGQKGVAQHMSAIGCVFDTSRNQIVDQNCSINQEVISNVYDINAPKNVTDRAENYHAQRERKHSSVESTSSGSWKSNLSEALSTQIDQLDRIILETSTVLSEGLSDSVCTVDGSVEQVMEDVDNDSEVGRVFENDYSAPNSLKGDSKNGGIPSQMESKMLLDSGLKLKEDSSLKLKEDSTLKLKEDSSLKLKEDSTLKLKEDSSLKLKEDSSLKLKETNTNLNDSLKDDKEVKNNLTNLSNSSADDIRNFCFQKAKPGELILHSSSNDCAKLTNTVQNGQDIEEGKSNHPRIEDLSFLDGNLSSQLQCSGKLGPDAPPKPARSKSLNKVTNSASYLQNDQGTRKLSDNSPRLPDIVPSLESHPCTLETDFKEAARPSIIRANSAPERPSLLYFPRKSRPPIPSILREKKSENGADDVNDGSKVQNLQEVMKLAEPHESRNKQDLSCKVSNLCISF